MKRDEKGITLITIIVTIVVLIILAGVSIATLTGENGILRVTNSAKEQTEISKEKELLELAVLRAEAKRMSVNGEKELREELNKYIGEKNFELEVIDNKFYVTFTESNRTYTIDANGVAKLAGEENNDNQPEPGGDDVGDIIINDTTPGDYTDNNRLDGSKEKPYEISSMEDLIKFSKDAHNSSSTFQDNM